MRDIAAAHLKWTRLISLDFSPANAERSKAVARRLGSYFEKTIPFQGYRSRDVRLRSRGPWRGPSVEVGVRDFQINLWTFAKGSQNASRCQSYSMPTAIRSAASLLTSRAITASVMSIPAETPEDVMNGPSSTQRACLIH